jgi:hypothetical protein
MPEDSFMAEEPGRINPEPAFTIEQSHVEDGVTVIDKARLTEVSLVQTPDAHARCPWGCQVHALSPHSTRLGPTPFYIACEVCQAHGPRAATIAMAWKRWDEALGLVRIPAKVHPHDCPDCLKIDSCADQNCKIPMRRPCGCIENHLGC